MTALSSLDDIDLTQFSSTVTQLKAKFDILTTNLRTSKLHRCVCLQASAPPALLFLFANIDLLISLSPSLYFIDRCYHIFFGMSERRLSYIKFYQFGLIEQTWIFNQMILNKIIKQNFVKLQKLQDNGFKENLLLVVLIIDAQPHLNYGEHQYFWNLHQMSLQMFVILKQPLKILLVLIQFVYFKNG